MTNQEDVSLAGIDYPETICDYPEPTHDHLTVTNQPVGIIASLIGCSAPGKEIMIFYEDCHKQFTRRLPPSHHGEEGLAMWSGDKCPLVINYWQDLICETIGYDHHTFKTDGLPAYWPEPGQERPTNEHYESYLRGVALGLFASSMYTIIAIHKIFLYIKSIAYIS